MNGWVNLVLLVRLLSFREGRTAWDDLRRSLVWGGQINTAGIEEYEYSTYKLPRKL